MIQKIGEKLEQIIGYATIVILSVIYPLYLKDGLFDITEIKYKFFINASMICLIAFVVAKLLQRKIDLWREIRWYDAFIIVFLIISFISMKLSAYPLNSFEGSFGRFTGYQMYLGYAAIIICMQSSKKLNQDIMVAIIESGGLAVAFLGLLNHFLIDPLGIYKRLDLINLSFMTSTLGNVNLFSVYVGTVFAIAAIVYIIYEKQILKYMSFVVMVITSLAVMLNNADMGYISIIVTCLVAFLFVRSQTEIKNWILVLFIVLAQHLWIYFEDKLELNTNSIDNVARAIPGTILYGMILAILIVVWVYLHCVKIERLNLSLLKMIYAIVLGLILVAGSVLLILVNFVWKGTVNVPGQSLLLITDDWGTRRGLIWRLAFEHFKDSSWMEKVIGVGPANYFTLYLGNDEVEALFEGKSLDNAHCEFLQLLLCNGILATVSYYAWVGIIVVKGFIQNHSKLIKGASVAIASYCLMLLVCINLSMVGVLAIVLVGLVRWNVGTDGTKTQ